MLEPSTDVVQDLVAILEVHVVICHDHQVGSRLDDACHLGPLTGVTVARRTEHGDDP